MTKMQQYLLWDKYNLTDRYGVINDDRMWYAITFLDLFKYG